MRREPLGGGEDSGNAPASEDDEIGLNCSAQRDEHDTAQDLLIAELQHRLRNLLTLVQFLIIHTQSDTLDRYQSALVARIRCLAEACELIDRCNRDPISLAEVLERTLKPYAAVFEGRIRAAGPDVDLEPQLGLALHLVFHELATNACKHGALSSSAGQVEVLSGGDLDETSLVIQWNESGGPEVREPQHRGFGLNLLSKILGAAKVELRFKPTGLTCSILVNIS
jgi:two-component sensor histidine kinase